MQIYSGGGMLGPPPPIRRKVPELELKMSPNYSYIVHKLRHSQRSHPLVVKTVIVMGPVVLDDKPESYNSQFLSQMCSTTEALWTAVWGNWLVCQSNTCSLMIRVVTMLFPVDLELKLWRCEHYSKEMCILRSNGPCLITAGRAHKGLLQLKSFVLRSSRSDDRMETKEKWVMITFCRKSYQTHSYRDVILKGFSSVFSPVIKEIHVCLL